MYTSENLDFAYRYPFTDTAKNIINSLNITSVDFKYLELGKARASADINDSIKYYDISIDSIKIDELISYVYARMMLLSLNKLDYKEKFALGESKRVFEAMGKDSEINIFRLSSFFGINLRKDIDKDYLIKFDSYLHNIPKDPMFALSNQELHQGFVRISFSKLKFILKQATYNYIKSGLLQDEKIKLPKEIRDYAKDIKDEHKVKIRNTGSMAWIEKLLDTPITDVRHRTVNLILAPYLTNVKGLSVDDAFKIISDYIERCKLVNPDTKINETYIRYQCEYAKDKKLKPLSLSNAKELLAGVIDFEVSNEDVNKNKKSKK